MNQCEFYDSMIFDGLSVCEELYLAGLYKFNLPGSVLLVWVLFGLGVTGKWITWFCILKKVIKYKNNENSIKNSFSPWPLLVGWL